jgi:DNA polymerase I-like protein with 3'-5' exonuclease and polymerase domains
LLGNPKIQKNVCDGKLLEVGLNRLGIAFNGVHFDILLAAYLLDSSLSNSSTLVYSSFGVDIEGGKEEEEVSLFASGHPTAA